MPQYAGAHQVSGRITFHACSKTTAGFLIHSEPFVSLDEDADTASLGARAMEVLSSYRTNIEPPEWSSQEWKKLRSAHYKAIGVRSERELMAKGRFIDLDQDNGFITVTPSLNAGKRGNDKGFVPLPDREIRVELGDVASVGDAILEAFRRCT